MNTLSLKPSFSPSIYSESVRKTVSGSIVLEDNILRYFMNIIDQDSAAVSIDTSLLTEQSGKDIAFDFEVYSSKQCTINFDGFNIDQYTVLRGLTCFRVTKYGGTSQWIINLKSEDYQRTEEKVLTYQDYLSNTIYDADRCGNIYRIFGRENANDFPGGSDRWNIYGNRKVYIHSTYGILLTKMQINVNVNWEKSYNYPTSIKVYGSNDMDTWTIIGSDMNPAYVKYTKYFINMNFEGNTYFRHFRIEFEVGIEQNECYLPYVNFFGIKDPNVSYTYKRIIPYMTANPQAGAQAIFDDTNVTNLANFPRYWFPRYMGESGDCYAKWLDGDMSNPLTFYVKVNDARIPALFGIKHYNAYEWRPIRYWKLYGSNSETVETEGDDETLDTFKNKTWTLICINQKADATYDHEEMEYHTLDCDTAYKYYKFEAITTYDNSIWRHWGMMLYYKDYGTFPEFDSIVPILSSNSQDGYMLNCSSESDGTAYRAFDGNPESYCGGQFTDGEWYLITKMATKTIINAISLTAPSSEYDRMPLQFVVEGSNDFTIWDTLFTNNNEDTWNIGKETRSWHFENSTGYLWYRLRVLRTLNASWIRISKIAFGVQDKIPGMSWYTDEYIVPVMQSNEQSGYIASAKSEYSSTYAPWKAFDRSASNADDAWVAADDSKSDGNKNCDTWIKIELPESKAANILFLKERTGCGSQDPQDFTLEASNDDETWNVLLTQTGQTYVSKSWNFDNETAYKYYRLCITKTNESNSHISVGIMNLINRTYYNL